MSVFHRFMAEGQQSSNARIDRTYHKSFLTERVVAVMSLPVSEALLDTGPAEVSVLVQNHHGSEKDLHNLRPHRLDDTKCWNLLNIANVENYEIY